MCLGHTSKDFKGRMVGREFYKYFRISYSTDALDTGSHLTKTVLHKISVEKIENMNQN